MEFKQYNCGGEDEKAKEFLQLQNRYLTFKQQLNTNTVLPDGIRPEEMNTSEPEVNLPTSTGDSTTGNSALYSPKRLQRDTKFKSSSHLANT